MIRNKVLAALAPALTLGIIFGVLSSEDDLVGKIGDFAIAFVVVLIVEVGVALVRRHRSSS